MVVPLAHAGKGGCRKAWAAGQGEMPAGRGRAFDAGRTSRYDAPAMDTHTVYLGLGANEPPAAKRIAQALEELGRIPGLVLDEASPVYRTEPQLYSNQPWFSNQVARVFADASWEPVPLMQRLLELETALGRVRSDDPMLRYGPRAIDIDMLLFDDLVSDHPVCTLPHPRLKERAFWLVPLRDIAPDLVVQGTPVGKMLEGFRWFSDGDRIWQ